MENQALEMWKIMLHRELECVPHLMRSETSAINFSPWKNPFILVSSGKVFVRTVDGEKRKQPNSNVLTTFKKG